MTEAELDKLLRTGLAPAATPPDPAFVARVDRAVDQAEQKRFWRARIVPQLLTEGIALAAAAGSLALLARIPEVNAALAETPELAWPALLALLAFWLLIRGHCDLADKSALIPAQRPWGLPGA